MGDKCRVLFVDDDTRMLSGVRRLLSIQTDWDTVFAESGPQALQILAQQPVDIVISDMKMRGMDGADLLEHIRHDYPDTIRIILSGQTSQQKLIDGIHQIHYFISKPYDLGKLTESIDTIHSMRIQLPQCSHRLMVAETIALPIVPAVYHQLRDQARSEQITPHNLPRLLSSDIGILCGLLHIAGAGFGFQATESSGLFSTLSRYAPDFILKLIDQPDIFKPFDGDPALLDYLIQINQHSFKLSRLSLKLARNDNLPTNQLRLLELFALLHDIGKLVLLNHHPEKIRTIISALHESGNIGRKAEIELFGISHSELGAYLLSIWGFPRPMIESVFWHHTPQLINDSQLVRYLAIAEAMLSSTTDSHQLLDAVSQHIKPQKLTQWMNIYQQWSHSEQEYDYALYSNVSR